jgi:NTE family protein
MARISSPADVHYLALEGGGGKGVTYLGAVRALENLGVLPIDLDRRGENQIRGISGASAGAITAMFLAMGFNSTELEQVLSNSSTFTGFFDGPDIGISRSVNRNNEPDLHNNTPSGISPIRHIQQQAGSISGLAQLASSVALLARSGVLGPSSDPIVQRLIARPEHYLYNLIFDRGLFPGIAARNFLQGELYGRLWQRFLRSRFAPGQPIPIMTVTGAELNFRTFYNITGVDLVITGANTTRHKPAIFSRRHTPEFPVAEAVGISMNLPVLFKPVHVEANVPRGQYNQGVDDYHGLWIDGGVLNNFPLHAFDFLMPPVSQQHPNLRPLNPNMLGLRLTDGPRSRGSQPRQGTFDILLEHLGNVMGTVLYPSEEGQIRSPDERDHTIDLFTYDLETTNFAPTASQSSTPIAEAQRAVDSYFPTSP